LREKKKLVFEGEEEVEGEGREYQKRIEGNGKGKERTK
jgi:hypothetical protein